MRRFPDFLRAYAAFYEGQVPPQFSTWVALSVVAGALERRVWLPWTDTYSFYPNIYVLLTGGPGCRKSTAIKYGTDMLRAVNRKTGTLNIMPSQVTEAKFIELMGHGRSFQYGTATVFQNSGYYFASEASNSLRNIFGEFIACLTDFYDCPDHWERATKKDGKTIKLQNVCMNILAGSTFDYLGKLVNDENIQGGFASRNIYVVYSSKEVKAEKWAAGLTDGDKAERKEYYGALCDDLTAISKLTGPMYAEPEFSAAWEDWYPKFHTELNELESENMRSILARTNTNVLKVSMLLSAAESNDCVLRLRHWEQARSLIEGINAGIPEIFQEAKAKQGPGIAGSLTAFLAVAAKRKGTSRQSLLDEAVNRGFQKRFAEDAITAMTNSGVLQLGAVRAGSGVDVEPGRNANKYF